MGGKIKMETTTEKAIAKNSLCQILEMNKDKRYRRGLLQGAVTFGIITHTEWYLLTGKYVKI